MERRLIVILLIVSGCDSRSVSIPPTPTTPPMPRVVELQDDGTPRVVVALPPASALLPETLPADISEFEKYYLPTADKEVRDCIGFADDTSKTLLERYTAAHNAMRNECQLTKEYVLGHRLSTFILTPTSPLPFDQSRAISTVPRVEAKAGWEKVASTYLHRTKDALLLPPSDTVSAGWMKFGGRYALVHTLREYGPPAQLGITAATLALEEQKGVHELYEHWRGSKKSYIPIDLCGGSAFFFGIGDVKGAALYSNIPAGLKPDEEKDVRKGCAALCRQHFTKAILSGRKFMEKKRPGTFAKWQLNAHQSCTP